MIFTILYANLAHVTKSNSKKNWRLEKSCQLLYPLQGWNYEQIIWKNPKLSPEKNDTESNFYLSTLHGKSKCAVCVCCVMNKNTRGVNVGACWGREVSDEAAARRHCNKLNVAEFRPTATVRMTRVSSLLNQWIGQSGADQRQMSLEFWIRPFYDITWICLTKFNNNNNK